MKRFSRSNPCPICGRPDWCGRFDTKDFAGGEMIVCMRDTLKVNQAGADGMQYVFIADSKSGNSIYEEQGQHAERVGARRAENSGTTFKKARPVVKVPVNLLAPQPAENLNEIYRFVLKALPLQERHRTYLHGQGWTDELIAYHNVASFPEGDAMRSRYKNRWKSAVSRKELAALCQKEFGENCLLGVPGAYQDKDGVWTFDGHSGILFPMYDLAGNCYRLRIRMDFCDVWQTVLTAAGSDPYYYADGCRYHISMKGVYTTDSAGNRTYYTEKGKYRTLSSYQEDREAAKQGYIANRLRNGTQSLNVPSFYRRPGDMPDVWYVTEGEPKAAYANYMLHGPVVSIPGVNSYRLVLEKDVIATMKAQGMKIMAVLFDADKYTNRNVLDYEARLVSGLKDAGIRCAVGEWDGSIGKGIDDLLAAGGRVAFHTV